MSRYVVDLGENKEFVYGWDHALGYFYELWDNSLEGDEDELRIIKDESYFLTKLSKGDMVEAMEKYKADKSHITKMSLDLPF
jgi:hypothetical protein